MKKFLSAFVVGVMIFSVLSVVLAAGYVGNANSKIFHYSDCSFVGKMNSANKVIFSSRDEAVQSGYRPCKKCHP
ncbi:MAG: hypothetical protein IK062_09830 [Selenomonadaceae bacterium]|nr:hypothetical protein [Selenomonadaceae bacterium]